MISVDEARKRMLSSVTRLGVTTLGIDEVLDMVLAEDVISRDDIPPFDNSAMDGYAVKSQDVKRASVHSPVTLKVVDDIKAGQVSKKTLKSGESIRIMTGAPMPKGADSVVMVEEVEEVKGTIKVKSQIDKGENVRCAGEDVRRLECVLKKGTLLSPASIGMLAALGHDKVSVFRAPRVAVLSTGDELLKPNKKLSPGKIRNSNSYSLCAQVKRCGAKPINLGVAKDKKPALMRKLKKGLAKADILITSAGVSVGVHDLVKDALKSLGGRIEFWRVAMKPGKPLAFGLIKEKPVFGLPGNPVSSMITFEEFVKPLIFKMRGMDAAGPFRVKATAGCKIEKKPGRKEFVRARLHRKNGTFVASPTGPQGSGILKSMVLCDGLVVLDERNCGVEKGERVNVEILRPYEAIAGV